MVANIETGERQSAGGAASSDEKSDQQLRTILENLGRVAHQDDLHSGFTPRLDLEAWSASRFVIVSEQSKTIWKGEAREGSPASCSLSGTWMVAGDQADDRE